jgi:outer membrane receptor for ferrienterochelin and colicin
LVFGDTKLGEIPQDFNVLSTTLDAEVQTNWKLLPGNLLIVGSNYRWITYISSHNLPEETHQHRLGFFIHDEQRLAQMLTLTADVRFDYNNITPFAISPRVAAVLRLSDNQSLRLSVGQAFHKPTFVNTSLHLANIQGDQSVREFFERSIGNKDLFNERITVLETGYLGHFLDKHLVVEGDLFFNLYRDTINSVVDIKYNSLGTPDLSRSVLQFQNNGLDADTVGGSLALTYRVLSECYMSANYTYRYSWYPSVPFDRANMGLEKRETGSLGSPRTCSTSPVITWQRTACALGQGCTRFHLGPMLSQQGCSAATRKYKCQAICF